MKRISKFFSAALAAVFLAPSAVASDSASAPAFALADSTSVAMATIVAQYISPALDRQFPADSLARIEFLNGISKAFDILPAEQAFHNGIEQGLSIINNLDKMRADGYHIDNAAFISALRSILDGNAPALSSDDAKNHLDAIAKHLSQSRRDSQQAFIDAQAARDGVIRQPSGLLFEVITEGEGPHPSIDDTVEVKYTGRLADGTVFDATSGDATVKFPIKGLIKGFSEGLMLMRPGGSYRLIIPPAIGYGDRGAGDVIPPGAALDFSVSLVSIVKK